MTFPGVFVARKAAIRIAARNCLLGIVSARAAGRCEIDVIEAYMENIADRQQCGEWRSEMGNFYTDVISKDPRFASADVCKDTALLEPGTRAAVAAIIADAAAMGITLAITETFRSEARQQLLYRQGSTQLRTVGVHHYGLAADFCKIAGARASWDGDWSFLRDLADRHGLISGLDWGQPGIRHSFIDPDHVQRCPVARQHALFAGTWYPEEA